MDDNDPKVKRKIRKLTMRIDRNLCIGAATCVAIAPKAWALDDEAKAIILDTAEAESDETLIEAARGCPVMAIFITDATGKQIFP
ncbi:MAG: ferredoxin [Candidatus Gottesmanbacteria bacterium]|nr:ferredoxin [Candidatus Gottesmanbacteria bacterium]